MTYNIKRIRDGKYVANWDMLLAYTADKARAKVFPGKLEAQAARKFNEVVVPTLEGN